MPRRALLATLAVIAMLAAILPLTAAGAAPATSLFISEYIEGSSNNKAVEIVNETGSDVDLSTFSLQFFFNGSASAGSTIALSGTLSDGDVFVVADDGSDAAILAVADLAATGSFFNGDDAVVLYDGTDVVDAVGQIGFDPGSQWGTGIVSTQDNTIRRLPNVCAGDTNAVDAFDPATEWSGYAQDTFDGLGSHTSNCGDGGTTTTSSSTSTSTSSTSTTSSTTTTIAPGGPDVVINEVDADTAGSDDAEFIELYALSGGSEDLSGLSLVFYNGSDDLSYDAIDLDGQSTGSDGYFVLCSGSGNVPECDFVGAFSDDGVQNGADAIVLVDGDAVDYPNDSLQPDPADIVDAIVYDTNDGDDAGLAGLIQPGHEQYNEDGAGNKDSHSNQRCPDATGTFEQWAASPGVENPCEAPINVVKIHEVQGPGASSPYAGQVVQIEGVVTGDYQGYPGLGGFFVQEEDGDTDGDPTTSEGIFVFEGGTFTDVSVGDVVEVTGEVTESFGHTQIQDVTVSVVGTGSVTPTPLSLPVGSLDEWEHVEGMRVSFAQTLHVTEVYTLGQYGEVVLSGGAPLDNPTNVAEPGAAANAIADQNDLNRIQLDDGVSWSNFDPTPYLGMNGTLRGGDTTDGLEGVVGYSFSSYEIQPVGPVSFTRANPRPAGPPSVGGDLTVAAFNVLNFFVTLDGSGAICGPTGGQDCRGADTMPEFELQRDKIVTALVELDADVVGLMEIENDASNASVEYLVDAVNAVAGAGTYDYVATGPVGSDAIKVAIIYKPDTVTPVGAHAVLDSAVDPLFDDDKNRPAVAQTFEHDASGERLTVAVNHLKSKGSSCDSIGDPDLGDGQGNCNVTRTNAANALASWLAADPTSSGDSDSIIIGDLNSYAMEDPIDALKGAGYEDLIATYQGVGRAAGAYSYVFQGEWGYLDHGLASASLAPQVTGADFWHINADEPPALDYQDWNLPANQTTDEFRSSDHDPVVVGLYLGGSIATINRAISELEDALPTGDSATDSWIAKAIERLESSINDRYWDDDSITSLRAFLFMSGAVRYVDLASQHGLLDSGVADTVLDWILGVARDEAQEAVDAIPSNWWGARIEALALRWMAAGDAAAAAGNEAVAIHNYRQAWTLSKLASPWGSRIR